MLDIYLIYKRNDCQKKKLTVKIIEYIKIYKLYNIMINIFYNSLLSSYFLLLLILNKQIQCCVIAISVKKTCIIRI